MWVKRIHRWPRRPLVLFGATATVLLGTLAWLTWHTLQQDQALVNQRIQERLDSTADLAAAALREKFSYVDRQLASLANSSDPSGPQL